MQEHRSVGARRDLQGGWRAERGHEDLSRVSERVQAGRGQAQVRAVAGAQVREGGRQERQQEEAQAVR